jgi:hypothetical protein
MSRSFQQELAEAEKYKNFLIEAAVKYKVPIHLLLAIGSRESRWGLALTPRTPAGTGDFIRRKGELAPDGRGWGRGLMQIDYAAHEFARGREWEDPRKNILYGAKVLRDSINFIARRFPNLNEEELIRAGIAGYNCFDDQTEVLTDQGWKTFGGLSGDEHVASYNIQTGEIEFSKPLLYHKAYVNGDLHYYKARGIDAAVTPGHRMMVSLTYDRPDQLVPSEDIRWKSFQVRNSAVNNNSEYHLSDDEIRLAAWILTDGTISYSSRSRKVQIYQRESNYLKITEILDRLNYGYSVRFVVSKVTSIMGRELIKTPERMAHIGIYAEYRDKIFKYISDKARLPEWVYKLSARQFDVFLDAYNEGDGAKGRKNVNHLCITGRPDLMDQLQIACIMNGHRAYIAKRRGANYTSLNIYKNRVKTRLDINDSVTIKPYSGYVYCVTTDNDTVVTRRNGKVLIAGNTGPGNVRRSLDLNRDVDHTTHGRDYSRDVLNRSKWFYDNCEWARPKEVKEEPREEPKEEKMVEAPVVKFEPKPVHMNKVPLLERFFNLLMKND